MMERLSTSVWEAQYGYCRAIKIKDQVFIAGTVAGGKTVEEQTENILKLFQDCLSKFGGSLENIVRTRMFVTNILKDSESIGKVHHKYFSKAPPTSTMVEVKSLIEPQYLIEIEADAILFSSKL